jgi:hypothetical protein
MIRRGLTLLSSEGGHVWVVLTDPAKTGGNVLIVNFTTYRAHRHAGEEIFSSSDYSGLSHDSIVLFAKAGDGTASQVADAISASLFRQIPDIPNKTLCRVMRAGKRSPDLSAARRLLIR